MFVPRESAEAEDDGWLVMLVHDFGLESADLVVLDAQDLSRGEVGPVELPARVPFGFHGNWISDHAVAGTVEK